ncbi:MAG TPA: lipopolysaccharide kinase InaA family protein, partial [Longimicrobiaceae bacterium]
LRVPDARDAAAWLAGAPADGRLATLREAGRQVGRMHAAGVAHPDLNLRNLLVRGAEVYLLDFDRARVYPGPVPGCQRERDLLRLARSARKLRAPVGPDGWEALREGYGAGWPLRQPLG